MVQAIAIGFQLYALLLIGTYRLCFPKRPDPR